MSITLSWVLSPQSRGINPVHPCEPLIMSLVVGFAVGEEKGKDREGKGRTGRTYMLNIGSGASEYCPELEGMPICPVGNSLEG